MKLHPTKLLVKDIKEDEKVTSSGIIIPKTLDKQPPQRGEVLECGEGTADTKMAYAKGDTILYNPHAGIKVTIDDNELRLLDEREVYLAL